MIDFTMLIPIVMFMSIAWTIERIVSRSALHKERTKAIEKGLDLSQLNDLNPKKSFFESNTLKYGLVAIGFSIGCLVGSFFEQNQILANKEIGYFFGVSLFSGIALVVSYYLNKKESFK